MHKEFVKTAQSGERSCLWSYEEQEIIRKTKKCMSIFRGRVYTAPGSFEVRLIIPGTHIKYGREQK
jgi:hypothetical protein